MSPRAHAPVRTGPIRFWTAIGSLVLAGFGTACRQATDQSTESVAVESDSSSIPEAWSALGLPSAGLVRVLPESDDHGFYADYAGLDRELLLSEVSKGLAGAGYSQTCTAVEGLVVGFSNGDRELALKIDMLPDPFLSLFDADGREPLLHGLCFGRYREGPWRTLSQEEKEALAEELESDGTERKR